MSCAAVALLPSKNAPHMLSVKTLVRTRYSKQSPSWCWVQHLLSEYVLQLANRRREAKNECEFGVISLAPV